MTPKITRMSMCIALGVALGFALSMIPNVELVTSTIFLSGCLLGPRNGFVVGLLTEGLYSMLNPYGAAAPPLFAAQVVSMGITGLAGGWFGATHPDEKRFFALKCGLAGFFCTLLFDALTTLAFVPISHFSTKQLAASMVLGVWFYAAHVSSNTVIFYILVPELIGILKKQPAR